MLFLSVYLQAMKKTVVILFLFSILLQTFSSLFIVANYLLNKEYISKNFCENRDKPKMHCNGKCHLMKQLQKQNKKENSPINGIKEKNEIQYFNETVDFSCLNAFFVIEKFPDFLVEKTTSPSFPVFRPPLFNS